MLTVSARTDLLTGKALYNKRSNVSQASRGFVSDSWPFLYKILVNFVYAICVGLRERLIGH